MEIVRPLEGQRGGVRGRKREGERHHQARDVWLAAGLVTIYSDMLSVHASQLTHVEICCMKKNQAFALKKH